MKLAGTRLKHTPSRAGLTVESKAGPVWNGQVRFNEEWLDQPLRWKRPRRIFVCAHGDLFAENANDVRVESYTVTSFRASRDFDHGPWRIRPYLGVNNLFDERYFAHVRTNAFGGRYFEPAPGRNAYAGLDLRYRFGTL